MACDALAERGAKIAMLSRSKKEMDNLKNRLKNPSNHISIKVDLLKNNEIKLAIKKAKKFLKQYRYCFACCRWWFWLKRKLIKDKDLKTLLQINLGAAAEINRLVVR